jgi:PIN domain nuclease of toxin-antitoxin system
MKLLLDTQTWFWIVEAPSKIPRDIRQQLDASPELWRLSIMSVWELSRKVSIASQRPDSPRAIHLGIPLREWLTLALTPEIEILPLSPEICVDSNSLTSYPNVDPVDCLIVATARILDLTVVTSDREMIQYPGVKALGYTPLRS